MSRRLSILPGLLLAACPLLAAADNDLPQLAAEAHLGVASCASGVCHGSIKPRGSTAVSQDEYVVWSLRDRHRIAYQTLLGEESKSIAAKLGLPNAHEADLCLDCHADNVSTELRGERFQLEDGVGCEACHGGAERYISSHVEPATPRPALVDAGLYPTDDPRARAKLCLSCHLGTAEKIASHEIMGAGHPRLSFELETFGVLQPAHYRVDEDYRREKWAGPSIELWAIGQVEAAHQSLLLIRDRLQSGGLFPELALFDCHACHHSMSEKRWQSSERSRLPPGSVRLNDANFVMLLAIASVLEPALDRQLRNGLHQLHQSAAAGEPSGKPVAALLELVDRVDAQLDGEFLRGSEAALVADIVAVSSDGRLNDYVAAEQAVMAVDMLLSVAGQREGHANWLEGLYLALADENHFEPAVFVRQMKRFGG